MSNFENMLQFIFEAAISDDRARRTEAEKLLRELYWTIQSWSNPEKALAMYDDLLVRILASTNESAVCKHCHGGRYYDYFATGLGKTIRYAVCLTCENVGITLNTISHQKKGKKVSWSTVKCPMPLVVPEKVTPIVEPIVAEVLFIYLWEYRKALVATVAAFNASTITKLRNAVSVDWNAEEIVKDLVSKNFWPLQVNGILVAEEIDIGAASNLIATLRPKKMEKASATGIQLYTGELYTKITDREILSKRDAMVTFLNNKIAIQEANKMQATEEIMEDMSEIAIPKWEDANNIFPEDDQEDFYTS